MTGRWLALGIALVLGAVAYDWWLDLTRGARSLGQASATVSISDTTADCIVKPTNARSGERVPCDEVSAYLRERLNLSPGASVGITALGKVTPSAVSAVSQELSVHGFKVAGVLHVGFKSEPGGAR